jgi:hypothetical protein
MTPLPLLVLEAGSGTKFLTIFANPTLWTLLGHTRNLGARQSLFPTIITKEFLKRNVALTSFMGKIAIIVTRR